MSYFLAPESGSRLPVSLLTGFLGSGKTTLLNKLLKHEQMARTAVVINEFGDVPLDQLFVEETDGEVTVLANGCLCCDVQGDLEGVIGRLFARRGQGPVPAFDRMLIETSGLADPAPIMQMLLNQPLIVDNFRLDAVVTTVDAVHARRQLAGHEEAQNQVALADRLVVTKTDLANAAPVVDALRRMNSSAKLMCVPKEELRPADLFGVDHARTSLEPVHAHLHGIETFTISFDRPVEWRPFSAWLTSLKVRHANQLLRVKGVVHVAGEEEPVAIHGVHHVFHPPMRVARPQGAESRIVFITKNLSREAVQADWRRTFQ